MQILNLINKEKSNIDYSISRFPDGEIQITLGEINHKDKVQINCHITSAEELFILTQVCDILTRHGVAFNICLFYLMSMRMDRVMDFNRPFSLSIVCKILDNLGAIYISIYSPHSEEYKRFFKNTTVEELDLGTFSYAVHDYEGGGFQLVLPDRGAIDRFYYDDNTIFGLKTRDLKTGKIISIGIENPEKIGNVPLIIRDDLCDGGGTFVRIAEAIRKVQPNANLSIYVDHMVNPKGIMTLSNTFSHVWFTNSYKDWRAEFEKQSISFPENVTQIDVV